MIPYINDDQANAATKSPHLKLLFRLLKFAILDESAEELEWYVPAALLPSDLQQFLNVMDQFIESPIDLDGKKAADMLSKKRRKRRARRAPSESEASGNEDEPKRKKKKEKKKKEEKQYKSAQFVEDSDLEGEELEAFFAKEKALREKMALAAATAGKETATMRARGTKKRRRKNDKTRKREDQNMDAGEAEVCIWVGVMCLPLQEQL